MAKSKHKYEPYDGLTIDGSFLTPQTRLNKDFTLLAANLLQFYLIAWDPDGKNEYLRDMGKSNARYKADLDRKGWTFHTIKSDDTPATALVAYNSDSIVVSFRGSGVQKEEGETGFFESKLETIKNVLTDLNIVRIADSGFPGKLHMGFRRQYLQIREEIYDKVALALSPVKGVVKKKNLFISGFSLGSGMASLCLWDLPKKLEQNKLNVNTYGYLFACPAAGDHAFEAALHEYNKNIFHIAHERDVIGQIPHSLFKEYRTTARKLLVFDTNPLKTAQQSPETVEQLKHGKMDINLKIKKTLPASVLTKVLYDKLWPYLVVKLTKDILFPFVRYHNGYFYKNCMVEMSQDFDRKQSGSTLAETAEAQYKLCQKHGI